MKNIEKVLSVTEMEKSIICNVSKQTVEDIVKAVEGWIISGKGNDKIVRVIVINNSVVKLQAKDNATPIIYNFEEDYPYWDKIEYNMELLSAQYDLVYSDLKISA